MDPKVTGLPTGLSYTTPLCEVLPNWVFCNVYNHVQDRAVNVTNMRLREGTFTFYTVKIRDLNILSVRQKFESILFLCSLANQNPTDKAMAVVPKACYATKSRCGVYKTIIVDQLNAPLTALLDSQDILSNKVLTILMPLLQTGLQANE